MATAKPFVDHNGKEFSSLSAMCEHWKKNRHTVRHRLSCGWPLEDALVIPVLPGFHFKLAYVGTNDKFYYKVAISPQYSELRNQLGYGRMHFMDIEGIKKFIPLSPNALKKGLLLGIY